MTLKGLFFFFFSVFFKKEINPASFEFFPALKSIKQKIPFFLVFFFTCNKMKLNNVTSSELEWISQLNVDIECLHTRRTSIIGTIGNKENRVCLEY